MSAYTNVARSRRNFTDEASRYDAKRERLVECARRLSEEGNANKVSVTDITSEMGITRGLFYYYFGGKDELNDAIADSYVEELMAGIEDACEQCEGREDQVLAVVRCVHDMLYYPDGRRKPIWHVLVELDRVRMVQILVADDIADHIIRRGMLVKYGKPSDEHLLEHARFVASGILTECALRPVSSIEAIADAACASLRYRKRRA